MDDAFGHWLAGAIDWEPLHVLREKLATTRAYLRGDMTVPGELMDTLHAGRSEPATGRPTYKEK